MKAIIIALSLISVPSFTSCKNTDEQADVAFAKTAFSSLALGEPSATEDIDWETLNSLGVAIGSQYLAIKKELEKENFKTGFVTQFSASFRDSGGSMDSLSNWRSTFRDDYHTIVTADSAEGSLKLAVSGRDSKRRLSTIEIIK